MHEKQQLFDYLLENAKEDNASCLYDPFFNNCATRPRDVLKEILGNELQFDDSYVSELKTIRQLYMDQLPINNWESFGITVALGSVIDRGATPFEHMYMPEYLKKQLTRQR